MLDFSARSLIELKDFLHILSSYHLFRKAAWSLVSTLDTTPYMVVCSRSKYKRVILPQFLRYKAFRDHRQACQRLIGRDAKMKSDQLANPGNTGDEDALESHTNESQA
jgi:hypothetical protein